MDIKGTAVISTEKFVKENHPDKYQDWLDSLPENSKNLFKDGILAGNWYPLNDAVIIPTKKIGEIFFNNNIENAFYEVGVFSAKYALKGVYKIFVRVASVDFVLKRLTSIFSTYYSEGKIEIINRKKSGVKFYVTGFDKDDEIMITRLSGWAKGVFEVISNKNITINYKNKITDNDKLKSIINANWE